ncbi:MAG: S23 ribosomal protein [Candidatus Woesebacteria bacterium GW2011_GWA2_40_7]|uniref:S23 ribosomal protein n=3 Tax=Candidatus Woeseibacteriota TaxID=1752722 RepID=A0A0G0PS65_9BACT|nr:MAG: S23 ribosomal protein [Candidatus Woesebacteria bacterium GW2011_GWB1_39_10]KKR73146.1 MAG: S23 ribosomal protein [Candidatus Woesebacteria bacterium GW2011_GWA2_40_7]KKS91141.1 MAG: S23 ribosomal protein [Candidatus Woesebacteria bacterium GW2011_GWA1_43_12]
MLNLSNLTSYKKLIIYQKAKSLVLITYRLTSDFPKTEIYTLVPQMRRAAISIMANIVEGYSKGTSAEYARFLTISIGSLTELEVYLDVCLDLHFISQLEFEKSFGLLIEVKKLLYSSRRTVRERIKQ